jgi:site-specific DNA-cytosine methylase
VVILENVPGLVSWGQDVLKAIVVTLQGCGYRLNMRTLSSDVHGGVPQHRLRLYIVALLEPRYAWEWPAPIPASTLPSLLADVIHPPTSRPTAPRAASKVDAALRELDALGTPARARAYVVVNCHSQLGEIFVQHTPCLTACRGAQGGFWLVAHSRMMTVDELLRLQGIDPASTRITEVLSARAAGLLIGNSFTLTVVGRVLVNALRCYGCPLVDPATAVNSS